MLKNAKSLVEFDNTEEIPSMFLGKIASTLDVKHRKLANIAKYDKKNDAVLLNGMSITEQGKTIVISNAGSGEVFQKLNEKDFLKFLKMIELVVGD